MSLYAVCRRTYIRRLPQPAASCNDITCHAGVTDGFKHFPPCYSVPSVVNFII